MTKLSLTLNQAWLERWNQRLEPAMKGLAEAQALAGWDELSVDAWKNRNEDSDEYLDALLLKSSLLRAQGFRQKSSALLSKVTSQSAALAKPRSFRLFFELGLDYWIDQDLAKALENFLLAERKAPGPVEQLFASSNVLWCLEALDLDRRETETKVEELLKSLSESERPFAQHVQELWRAYELRRNFYRDLQVPTAEGTGLGSFFTQWANSLPYVRGENSINLGQDYLWQGSYRLRTLARIWIAEDRSCLRIGDAIDRFYLWTWLKMAGRPEISKEKIFYTLESILEDFVFENQSKENLLLFRNALGWALILYPSLKTQTKTVQKNLSKVSSQSFPMLEAEYCLMRHLSGQEDTEDFTRLLQPFPAFQKILRDIQSPLPVLQERLTPLMAKARAYDMIIDESREEILFPQDGRIVRSKGLSRLFRLLMTDEEVPLTEIEDLDAANLIFRARKLLGPETIHLNKKILTKGPRWPKAFVVSDIEFPLSQMSAIRPSLVDSKAYLQAAKALLPASFQRKELEKNLDVSKATANRMIETWLEDGKIVATGKAKATAYAWKEDSL